MRKALRLIVVFAVLFLFNSVSFSESADEKEYLKIFADFMRVEKGDKTDFAAAALKTAGDYERFIRDYPGSELVDEAKLRIAEFYELGYQKQRSEKWLDDIIENHPNACYHRILVEYGEKKIKVESKDKDGKVVEDEFTIIYYKDFKLMPTETKTAAWALYYRVLWFWYPAGEFEKAEEDLLAIINDYKESEEPVNLAKALLNKIRKLKKDRMQFEK